jgi:hypothetical protein
MSRHWRIPALYAVAIPLALILGFLASSPDPFSFAMVGTILLFLALPLFLKWHHALLIASWNTAFNLFFLPGQPDLWLVVAVGSFALSALNYFMFHKPFIWVSEMAWPLLFLAFVVIGTACLRGGIGIRSLGGGKIGGRYYVYLLGAIIGFFALTAHQIPGTKGGKMTSVYFLSGTTYALCNIAFALGPAFYFMYYLVPAGVASTQAASEAGVTDIDRIEGLAPSCTAVFCFLLAHYGIRGLFVWSKPWRLIFLILTVGASFFAGFRSVLLDLLLIFAFQFYLEGLWRTRWLPIFAGFLVFLLLPVVFFSEKMPPVVQRTISFLPVPVDSEVRADAKGSSEWRFEMWSVVVKDVPKYFWLGKGYGIDPTDMFLTMEGSRMGLLPGNEEAILAGDYHSGPLSVIIPFGILGLIGFLWVVASGGWVLFMNYRYGEGRLRMANCALLAYYLAFVVSFIFIFGALSTQLTLFLGAVGLSISLNGGVKRKHSVNGKPVSLAEIITLEPSKVKL